MNRRLGVIAVSGLDSYNLADLFPMLPEERFESSNDWAWLRFDLDEPLADSLDADEVPDRLGKLKGLALDIRAEPDDHWRLSLFPRKGKPLHVALHHELYRPASSPPGPGAKLPAEDMLARLDGSLPESFRTPADVLAKVAGKPRAKAIQTVKKALAASVAEVFDRSGLNQEVREELMGERSSKAALRAPYGTLPKFLDAIGLGKAWSGHDGTWKVGPLASSVGSFSRRRHLYSVAPAARPIAGGPVDLPAADLSRFWLLPWFCETDSETDILVTPPSGSRVPLPLPEYWVTIHRRGLQAYLEVAWNPPGPRHKVYRVLGQALAAAPAGTVVEFASSITSDETDEDEDEDEDENEDEDEDDEDEEEDETKDASGEALLRAGAQRYIGTVTGDGTFRVTHAWPEAGAEDLRSAMEICRQMEEPKPRFAMASEAEARAVVELARGTDWFADEKSLPKPRGSSVVPASRGQVMTTAMMVFRRRFAAGPWDTGAGQRRDEESHQEWEETIEEVGKTVGAVLAAPTGDDVILTTERATFRRADWSKMKVGVLDAIAFLWGRSAGEKVEEPETAVQKLEPVDRALAEMGFAMLGDVHCDRLGELYLRAYGGPDGDAFGCVVAGTFGQFVFEFVTRFSDGANLTTSTTPHLKDQKKRRIFKRSYPDLDPPDLYEKHRSGIAELTSKRAEPLPIDATIEGFCRALDDYIAREM